MSVSIIAVEFPINAVDPFVVHPLTPPNAPELLYCSCVLEPPGVPPPPELADELGNAN